MAETKVKMILFFAIITISIHRSFSCSSFEIPWKRLWTKDCPYTTTPMENSKERVSSLSQLQKGDHIALPRSAYWHHALVEDVDTEKGEINVIEYSNTVKGFSQDNSSPPKNPGIAEVKRGRYKLENDNVHLIKCKECLDPETAISRARSRLGERKYDPITNNCEHFVVWCKTGVSSSQQGDKAKKVFDNTKEEFVKEGLRFAAFNPVTQTGQTIMTTGMSEVTKEAMVQTVSKGEQIMMTTTKQVFTNTLFKEIAAQTVTKSGQALVKLAGVNVAAKQIVAQSVSSGGEEVVKTGTHQTAKELFTHTVSNAGQQIVKTGTRVITKEVFTHTASKEGKEIVTKGIRVSTKEVFKETTTKTGSELGLKSLVRGAVFAAAFEGMLALHDINCARKDMQTGKMNQGDFQKTVQKRVVSGIGNVAGSTAGATIGQVLIPVPILGSMVGGVVGGLAGRYFGDIVKCGNVEMWPLGNSTRKEKIKARYQ